MIEKENTNYYILNDIFAFIDPNGYLRLTDPKSNLISFDGIHLTEEGAKLLAKFLEKDQIFRNIFKIGK